MTDPLLSAGILSGQNYADLNLTYGWRGAALTAGIMKQSTGDLRSGWHVYAGSGLASAGLSVALTVSPNDVSTGWNAALSRTGGRFFYQFGLDAAGTPFTETGIGGPRGTALVAYRVWRL